MEKTDKYSAADLVMGILLIMAGIAVIYSSLQMKVYKTFLDAPGFFPLILGIIFNILGLLMIVSAARRKGHLHVFDIFSPLRFKAVIESIEFRRVSVLIFLMVVYIFVLIGRVHFTLATFLYLFFTFLFLKSTSVIKNLAISLVTALLVSALFTEIFSIPLPH